MRGRGSGTEDTNTRTEGTLTRRPLRCDKNSRLNSIKKRVQIGIQCMGVIVCKDDIACIAFFAFYPRT